MTTPRLASAKSELHAARNAHLQLFLSVAGISVFVNLLMLTGPLFMLQIYDRVLSSRSEATLTALVTLVIFLFLILGVLDHARGRIVARIGAQFQSRLDRRVFTASVAHLARNPGDATAITAQRDLEAIQRLLSSPVFLAVFDLPWTPFFILAIYYFHPMLGLLALIGGIVLVVITLLNQWLSKAPLRDAAQAGQTAEIIAGQIRTESELVRSLGMQNAAFTRWYTARGEALRRSVIASDRGGLFTNLSKTFRQFLQSAMLALGAWLVLRSEVTPGVMIASSIILGRALAPVEQVVGQWALIQRALQGWSSLQILLESTPPEVPRTALPRPVGALEVTGLTVTPPADTRIALRGVSFTVSPGQALGVIGPSGAGKSTLARAVIGAWPAVGGQVRLGGVPLDQFDNDILGSYIGYLPQRIVLFDGTIAENIARLLPSAIDSDIVAAAQKAGAHDMILALPNGYNTRITAQGGMLSGGQIQRIGLARALFGNPVLLVLDEPNSNLDNDGSVALNGAIRQAKSDGAAVLIMAHRPAAIQECDLLLMLEGGKATAFGPRDEVLRKVVRNHTEVLQNTQGATR
jgi:ATP-binding cassette subfamily C protein